jgi:hypothetical protein
VPDRYGVADAGVHALPAERAVVVRGVAGQHDPSGVETIGDPVLDQEPGAPDDVLDHRPRCAWAAGVDQLLHETGVRLGWRGVHVGHELVAAVWKRYADQLPLGREEDRHLVRGYPTGQVHVGQ